MSLPSLARIGASVALAAALALPAVAPASAETRSLDGPGLTGVVPKVKTFTAGSGAAFFATPDTRIIIPAGSTLADEAELLADELVAIDVAHDIGMGAEPEVVTAGTPRAGDIVLNKAAVSGITSDEGYSLTVDDHATITGPSDAGVFYGTRTLLQSLVNGGGAQAGTVIDEPAVEVRSLHVDAARKYFSPVWFHDQIRQMSWVKLNQLQYHFSENEGFRLESTTHPEIVSDEYITKAELAEIIALAGRHHIEVVPALDVPGHMRQALNAHPEWRASETNEGNKILDYSKPEVRKFVTDLIDEYAPLFPSTAWHLGGDEVFDIENTASTVESRFPRLLQYARDNVATSVTATPTVMDGYVHYINTVADYLETKGKTDVRAWNDAVYTPGSSVKLDSDIDIAYWTKWHWSMPTVATIKANGHDLINFNDAFFYYVLTSPGRAYFNKPTAQNIYANWTPGRFPNASGAPQMLAIDDPQLLGASFALWNDEPDQDTEEGVAAGIKMPLRAMAAKSWNPADAGAFADWNTRALAIGDAPVAGVEPTEPSLTATLTAAPSGTVDPGTTQTWSLDVANAGAAARATVTLDFASLAALAILGDVTATMVDADGNPAGEPGTNLARGATVRSSGQEVPDRWGPALAVDGDATTRFSSNTSDSAWIAVQLPQATVVDHVTIDWELAAARFKIQVSDDGTTWRDATAELTAAVDSTSTITLNTTDPVSWVRMQALERSPAQDGQKYGVSLFEFEVWDGAERGVETPAPVVSGSTVTWSGAIPAGYTLQLKRTSTINADATPGATFTVTADVDSPYFPDSTEATVTGRVTPAVADTTAPSVQAIEDWSVEVGAPVRIEVTATDASAPLAYSATGLPSGMGINAATGVISGTPTAAGTSLVTVTVTDPAGNKGTARFTLTVTEVGDADSTAPVVTQLGAQKATQGTPVRIAVAATDDSAVTYSATGLPAGVSIDAATGVISGTPVGFGSSKVTVTVTDAAGNSSEMTFALNVARKPYRFEPSIPYTVPGMHLHNGRQWNTTCEAYSQTERCRTEIWASVVKRTGSTYSIERGWAFNNLTYLPYMTRSQWASNPLGRTDAWTASDNSKWSTECDTDRTGGNACRSYRWTTVYSATPKDGGGYTFGQENTWVFNNIVMFRPW